MSANSSLLVILSISMLLSHPLCKLFTTNFHPPKFRINQGWLFVGRFTAQPTQLALQLHLSIRNQELRPQAAFHFQLAAVPSALWQHQLDTKCQNQTFPTTISSTQQTTVIELLLNQANLWQSNIHHHIQLTNPITYNFVLKDCQQSYLKQSPNRHSSLHLTLQTKNNDLHYTATEIHNLWTLPLFILLTLTILRLLKHAPHSNWTVFLFRASLYCGISSLTLKYLDHLLYAYLNGRHLLLLDILYLLLHALSDSLLIFLLLYLSYGWTIHFLTHKQFQIWLPITLILAFLHIVVTAINTIRDGLHDKYHMFDTFAGYLMVAFRILALVVLLLGITRSYSRLSSKDARHKNMLVNLLVFGVAYLGFLPLAMVLVQKVQEQHRHEVMVLAVEVGRFMMNVWFAVLVGSERSSYRQLATGSFIEQEDMKRF